MKTGWIRLFSIFLLTLALHACKSKRPANVPMANKGVIDLQSWDFDKHESIELDGIWEFYWKSLMISQDFVFPENIPAPQFIKVPGSWNALNIKHKKIPTKGFATYRLRILLPKKIPEKLGIKVPSFRTNGKVFINGRLVFQAGVPAKTKEKAKPAYRPSVIEISPDWSEIELIIQVSNFHYKKSGILSSIVLGNSKQVSQLRLKKVLLDMILVGVMLFVGLYHLSLFWLRRKSYEALYFGLFCLLLCLRVLSVGERPLLELISIPWFLLIKMEFFGFYAALGVFTMFCYSVFPQVIHLVVARINLFLSGIGALFVIFAPPFWFAHLAGTFQVVSILSGAYVIYVLFKNQTYKKRDAQIFLTGWVIFFIAIVHDVLFVNGYVKGAYFFDLGFLVFILFQTYALTLRFSQAFKQTEKLTQQLDATNKDLEKIVADKTESLLQANQHLSDRQKAMRENLERIRNINDQLTENSLELRGQLSAINRTLGFVEISPKGKILEVNSIFSYITGYEREALLGRDHKTLLNTDEFDESKYNKFWSDLSKGIPASGESKFIAQNKSELWFATSYTPIIDQQGHISKIILLTNDITAQKLQNLEFEAQYKAVNLLNATFELDMHGNILKANDIFLELIGYNFTEIAGRSHYDILSHDLYSQEEFEDFWQTLVQQESWQGEILLQTKHQQPLWLAGSYNVVKNLNGEPQKILNFARDVTQTKKIAQEYKQLSLVARKTSNAVVISDPQGRVQWANEGFTRITGYTLDEVLGKNPGDLLNGQDTDQDTLKYIRTQIIAGKEVSADIVGYNKQKEKYWVNLNITPVYDDNGMVVNLITIEVDVTERKRLEEEILKAKERTEKVYAITSNISGDLKNQLQEILKFATNLLSMEVGIISEIKGDSYKVYDVYSPDGNIPKGQVFDLTDTYCEITLTQDTIIAFDSVINTPYSNHPCYSKFQLLAYVGVAIRIDGKIFGTLNFSSSKILAQPVTQGEKDFVLLLSEWIGAALSRLRHEQKLKIMNEEAALMNTILNEQNHLLDNKNTQLEKQSEAIQEQYHVITDSIEYAERIQHAILPPISKIQEALPESFVFYKPRDIVSGDLYWFAEKTELGQHKIIVAVLDCTGHGVPGAFMSMIGNDLLNQVVHDKEIHAPEVILQKVHRLIRHVLRQDELDNNDGMDIGIITIDKQAGTIDFAGARHSLMVMQEGKMEILKGDRLPLGGEQLEKDRTFQNYRMPLPKTPGSLKLYMASDGFQDQFGGPKGRKFMTLRFRELLQNIHHHPMATQHQLLEDTLAAWMVHPEQAKRRYNQIDDILVMGICL